VIEKKKENTENKVVETQRRRTGIPTGD